MLASCDYQPIYNNSKLKDIRFDFVEEKGDRQINKFIISNLKKNQAKLNDKDKETVMEHAHKMATFIHDMKQAPRGAEQIIREHHGMRNGIGYAEVYTSSLGAMSIMFIVLEDFVTSLLDFKEKGMTIKEILEDMQVRYTLPSYKKIITALSEALTDSF